MSQQMVVRLIDEQFSLVEGLPTLLPLVILFIREVLSNHSLPSLHVRVSYWQPMAQAEIVGLQLAEMNRRPSPYEISSDKSAGIAIIRKDPENQWRTRHIAVKGVWLHQRAEFVTLLSYLETTPTSYLRFAKT